MTRDVYLWLKKMAVGYILIDQQKMTYVECKWEDF